MDVPFGRDSLVSDPLGPRPRANIQSNRAARAMSATTTISSNQTQRAQWEPRNTFASGRPSPQW